MTWAWLAVDTDVQTAPDLTAAVTDDPHGRRWFAWGAGRRPHRDAIHIDAAVLDASGAAGVVVWQHFLRQRAPLFDDPAVQGLTRFLAGPDLSGRQPRAVTTFTRDPVHYAGGLTVHDPGADRTSLARDSRLRRLGPVDVLAVDAGLFGTTAPRPGPGTQRYAGQPWPATGF